MPVLGPPMGHPQGPPIQVWGNGGNGPMTTPIPPQHMGYGGGPMPPVPPMMGYPPQQMSDDAVFPADYCLLRLQRFSHQK